MGHSQSDNKKPAKADVSKTTLDDSKRGLRFGTAAMRGWRKFMEDTHLAMLNFNGNPDLDLFAVFDGHGGCQVAILVKEEFPKELAKNNNFLQGNYPEALRQTFIKMDEIIMSDYGVRKLEDIIDHQVYQGNCKNLFGQSIAGCTALVCLVTDDKIYIANAGDSRGIAYVSEETIAINTEHKPTLHQEQMRIRLAGGYVEYGRILGDINISRCLGDITYKSNHNLKRHEQMIICDPQIVQVPREHCDYILLGSDGIWQSKSNQVMHKWLAKLGQEMALSKKLELLFDSEVSLIQDSQFGKDNMTAVLIEFH